MFYHFIALLERLAVILSVCMCVFICIWEIHRKHRHTVCEGWCKKSKVSLSSKVIKSKKQRLWEIRAFDEVKTATCSPKFVFLFHKIWFPLGNGFGLWYHMSSNTPPPALLACCDHCHSSELPERGETPTARDNYFGPEWVRQEFHCVNFITYLERRFVQQT